MLYNTQHENNPCNLYSPFHIYLLRLVLPRDTIGDVKTSEHLLHPDFISEGGWIREQPSCALDLYARNVPG